MKTGLPIKAIIGWWKGKPFRPIRVLMARFVITLNVSRKNNSILAFSLREPYHTRRRCRSTWRPETRGSAAVGEWNSRGWRITWPRRRAVKSSERARETGGTVRTASPGKHGKALWRAQTFEEKPTIKMQNNHDLLFFSSLLTILLIIIILFYIGMFFLYYVYHQLLPSIGSYFFLSFSFSTVLSDFQFSSSTHFQASTI